MIIKVIQYLHFVIFLALVPSVLFAENNFVVIVNKSDKASHFSYENKYGEIVGVRVPNGVTRFSTNESVRVTFDHLFELYPYILFPQDTITMSFINNKPIFSSKKMKDLDIYRGLEVNYSILKSPYSGIEYSVKTRYDIIASSIKETFTKRLDYIKNKNLSPTYTSIYTDLIFGRYVDEMLSPYIKFNYKTKVVPAEYEKQVENDVDSLIKRIKSSKNGYLMKQYVWGALKFKCRNTMFSEDNFEKTFLYIRDNFPTRIADYLCFRLLKEASDEGKDIHMPFKKFALRCKDKDYLDFFTKKRFVETEVVSNTDVSNTLFYNLLDENVTWKNILKSHSGKIIYVDFWASWCRPCLELIPYSNKLSANINSSDFVIVYINIDDNSSKWINNVNKAFALVNPLVHYRMIEEKSALSNAIRLSEIPRYMIIDKRGNVVTTSAFAPNELKSEKVIRELLQKSQ